MRRDQRHQVGRLHVAALAAAAAAAAALLVASPTTRSWGDEVPHLGANEQITIGGSVSKSTITNTINQENPATLAMLAKALSDKDASDEKRREADVKAAELANKWRFTSSAVIEFFRILREQNIPDEKVPARLIEIAIHFSQTQNELAALEPADPRAAEIAQQAKLALDAGRLAEADDLLDRAKDLERAALREAQRFIHRAQDAADRHAFNLARMEATQGEISLTQLHYADAATHYEAAAADLPLSATDTKVVYLDQAGDARQTSGNLATALTDYRALDDLCDRLAKADPGNARWQRDLSVSHNKIGDVQQAQGDLAAALTSYQASHDIFDAAGESRPRQRRLAARPLGLARQDRRRAAGAGRPGGGADAATRPRTLSLSVWRKRTPATPAGSATSRSRTTRSATCSGRRATWRRR